MLHWVNPTLWLGCTITVFVLSTSSIRADPARNHCWGASYLLGHTWACGICYLDGPCWFCLGACGLCSCYSLNLFSFLLLSLQFLSNVITLSYHCSIEPGCCSDSMSLWHIVALIPLLNFSISSLLSYIHYLLLSSWTPVQTLLLSFPLVLTFSTLLLLLIPHLLLQILFLCLLKILQLTHIITISPLDLPMYFPSIHLLIPPVHIITPTESAL